MFFCFFAVSFFSAGTNLEMIAWLGDQGTWVPSEPSTSQHQAPRYLQSDLAYNTGPAIRRQSKPSIQINQQPLLMQVTQVHSQANK
jgi:hypothetical protein